MKKTRTLKSKRRCDSEVLPPIAMKKLECAATTASSAMPRTESSSGKR